MNDRARESRRIELMTAALDGDAAAYRALLQDIAPAVRATVRRVFGTGYGAEIEDVVQETLLAIHLKRHTWRMGEPLGPWIGAIARHKVIDAMRRRGRRLEVALDGLVEEPEAETSERDEDRRDAQRLIAGLNPRQQDIVRSISLDGRTVRETAQRLEMTEVAVRVTLHRALKALAALYRKGRE
ncbi:RNA polymerase sigma-70 factor (ECF subfamily) [Constrictibacter sp. MBR-5]|uniref:sigma-70 family RNA polymerase sigma factor n=1 Tax=Constrictibacter sp. MBR-5 TaxID=3156467 RepID=UPI003390BEB5